MSRILGRFEARGIFEGLKKKADKSKCLSAVILPNEADGARTHNLRIDNPTVPERNIRTNNPYV